MLSTRQRKILNLIVADYIRTAIPVSSEAIARRREIDVSSATVRNDVAVLEDAQYITRPHASAGSVPTDQGYRLHVGPVLSGSGGDLPVPVRRRVERRLIEVERELDEWARVAADILSSIAGNMAIATFPRPRVSRVTHVEMIPIQGFLGMMIVVLEQAGLRRQVIQLEEPVEQLDLYNSMNRVKRHVMGLTRHEIEAIKADLTPLEESMVEETILILKEEEQRALLSHNVDGLLNLLRQPEFENNGTFIISSLAESQVNPIEFSLGKAFPNPFNPTTTINFAIPTNSDVSISVYNLQGRKVASLVSGNYDAGYHQVIWNGDTHGSGVYFVKMIAGEFTNTQKLMLVK